AVAQNPVKKLGVLSCLPRRTCAEALVPTVVVAEDLAPGREVVTAARDPWKHPTPVIDGTRSRAQGDCVGSRRLRSQRHDASGHGSGLRIALEGSSKRGDPSRVGRTVVVGDCQHVAAGRSESKIAGCGEAEAALFD